MSCISHYAKCTLWISPSSHYVRYSYTTPTPSHNTLFGDGGVGEVDFHVQTRLSCLGVEELAARNSDPAFPPPLEATAVLQEVTRLLGALFGPMKPQTYLLRSADQTGKIVRHLYTVYFTVKRKA